jgi:hypothetical protein
MNSNERLQDRVLLLTIPMGTGKKFSENYRQFGYALSKGFASPDLEVRLKM